ncbi:MAG: hypothetical protein ACKOJI_04270, partial [Phycisphaerales bacterium]
MDGPGGPQRYPSAAPTDGRQPGGANARPPESTDGAGMQVTADELRGAIAGQWVVAPPVAA